MDNSLQQPFIPANDSRYLDQMPPPPPPILNPPNQGNNNNHPQPAGALQPLPPPQAIQQQHHPVQAQPPQLPNYNETLDTYMKSISNLPPQLRNDLIEQLMAVSTKRKPCAFNHFIASLPDDPNNVVLMGIKNAYSRHNKTSNPNEEDYPRLFDNYCEDCCNLKLGLVPISVEKTFNTSYSCTNPMSRKGNVRYNIGPFMAANNPYKSRDEYLHHPSQNIGINPGCIILPTGKLLMQILSLKLELLVDGLKVIQIMTSEKNITNPDAYFRFIIRNNDNLSNGYYIIDNTKDLKRMNSKDKQVGMGKYYDQLVTNNIEFIKTIYPTQQRADPHTSGLNYIPEIDDEDNYDNENIFQNGTVMKFVNAEETVDPSEIKMKVFDINPTLIRHLQTILNIQAYLNGVRGSLSNKSYLDSVNPHKSALLERFYHDLLTMAFTNEQHHAKFLSIPPLNDKCVFATQNVLLLNKDGDIIMIEKENEDTEIKSTCSMFNKLITKNYPNHSSRLITPTAASGSVNTQGILPSSGISTHFLSNIKKNLTKADEDVKDKYQYIFEEHKDLVSEYHSKIKGNSENLYNYFHEFKDDMNNDILDQAGYEMILEFASLMYPEKILRNSFNKKHHSLDYTVSNTTAPRVDEEVSPNVAFAGGIGFVTLTNICDYSALTLKNTSVPLNNLINRCSNNANYKRSRLLNNDQDDGYLDDHARNMNNIAIVNHIPKKLKSDYMPEGVVNLCKGNPTNFDYGAYSKLQGCDRSNFGEYMAKYANNPSNKCLNIR